MSEKITGYILLFLGITLIILALLGVYWVFSGKSKPYPLFSLSGISLDLSNLVGDDLTVEQKQNLIDSGALKTELVESTLINQPLNLITHLLFMGFVANIGYKLASLGVQFLRPLKINLRSETKSIVEP